MLVRRLIEEGHVVIPRETISRLIDKYCRESGLRHVKSLINRIFSKASMKIVEQVEENQPEVEGSEEIVLDASESVTENGAKAVAADGFEYEGNATSKSEGNVASESKARTSCRYL